MSLYLVPVNWQTAREFVKGWHRHNKPPAGHKFSIGVADDGLLVGVAVVGRPVARAFDDGGWDVPSRPRDNGTYLSTDRTLWESA